VENVLYNLPVHYNCAAVLGGKQTVLEVWVLLLQFGYETSYSNKNSRTSQNIVRRVLWVCFVSFSLSLCVCSLFCICMCYVCLWTSVVWNKINEWKNRRLAVLTYISLLKYASFACTQHSTHYMPLDYGHVKRLLKAVHVHSADHNCAICVTSLHYDLYLHVASYESELTSTLDTIPRSHMSS